MQFHHNLVREEKINEQFEPAEAEQEITEIFKLYFQSQKGKLLPNGANMAAFITVQTIKSLIHAAARRKINSTELSEFKTEMTDMLSRYLTSEKKLLVF